MNAAADSLPPFHAGSAASLSYLLLTCREVCKARANSETEQSRERLQAAADTDKKLFDWACSVTP